MTKIQVELSDATAKAAREAGLLSPRTLGRLVTEAIKRRWAADSLPAIADRVAEAGIAPMSMKEIDAEVRDMQLSTVNALLTRWIFKTTLLKSAYPRHDIERLAAASRFGGCEIVTDGIGFELRLFKQP